MPAPVPIRPRERLVAIAAAALLQIGLGVALLSGFRVDTVRGNEFVSRLIEITLAARPPPVPVPRSLHRPEHRSAAAPKAAPKPIGGSPGPIPSRAAPIPIASIPLRATAPASGGGAGAGLAVGAGAGGGSGGWGYGDSDGGTDLVQIAGEIRSSDYPRDLRERGIGGRVGILFTVDAKGRVASCTVTRSSGVPELDLLTCRLIQQRFRYRPSTDRFGRPIPDEVEGEHDWVAR